ncbi:MAG: GDP-L-fucose synthase [Saprospiraceae bacterium]|nr:GDP-L-fucose synthase [Saprospiraceae bacterium]
MNLNDRVYVAGHRGMVGSAIMRKLRAEGHQHIITASSQEVDLRDQRQVQLFFEREQPKYVFLAAAKVGGIHANNIYRADFLYDNLMIESNVIHASHEWNVDKLLFLGSSCIYPKHASQPMTEEQLLTGSLEPTNEPYAIAKIAGIKLCEAYRDQYGRDFISAMPTNLYGPNDNYDLENSHVLPALLRKFHTAKREGLPSVQMWGSGSPLREFLHVDDLAEACVFLMHHYSEKQFLNIGSATEISIKDLGSLIAEIVGYDGEIVHDLTKPDGTPRKLMDSSKINALGWQSKISLSEGIRKVYAELLDQDWY